METQVFKPLREFGSIALSEESELKFYVDEYRGTRYAAIRTFVKRESYSGPTKAGITLNAPTLQGVIAALGKLPPEPKVVEETELARLPRKAGVELVVRVTIYKDSTGIDLREWVDEPTYKGWSKKGVRIPYQELRKALGFLKAMPEMLVKK